MKYLILICAAALLITISPAWADSLAVGPNAENASLFSPRIARSAGDQVTILLVEKTSSSIKIDGTINKGNEVNIVGIPTDSGPTYGLFGSLFGGILNSKNKYNNNRSTALEQSLNTSISARVTEVLPNGDLAIEASKALIINTEPQVIKIKGIIRTMDIAADNTIQSNRVSNAHIICDGIGREANKHRSQSIFQQFQRIFF
jgi:flagellar L-ring protein FlgH